MIGLLHGLNAFGAVACAGIAPILCKTQYGWRSVYLKLRRRGSFDFPILGVAVALRFAGDDTIADARITLGAVASHPVEATEAAKLLPGQHLTPELISEVATLAAKRSKPLDNADLTINYRKQVTPVYIRRALASFV